MVRRTFRIRWRVFVALAVTQYTALQLFLSFILQVIGILH